MPKAAATAMPVASMPDSASQHFQSTEWVVSEVVLTKIVSTTNDRMT